AIDMPPLQFASRALQAPVMSAGGKVSSEVLATPPPLDVQSRTAILEPHLVVEVVAPTADLALVVQVEHADARQLEPPPLAIEIPTVEAFRADRVAAAEHVEQLPFDLLGEVHDALDDLPDVVEADDGLEWLVDVHDVRREACHRVVHIQGGPGVDEAAYD